MSGRSGVRRRHPILGAALVAATLAIPARTSAEALLPGTGRTVATTPPPIVILRRKSLSPLTIPDPTPDVATPPGPPPKAPETVFERCRTWPPRDVDPNRPAYCGSGRDR